MNKLYKEQLKAAFYYDAAFLCELKKGAVALSVFLRWRQPLLKYLSGNSKGMVC